MELRDYLAIRRAYNLVRQGTDSASRLTFAELAILCRMKVLDRSMTTSEIAEYQGALRPTMTHRTKHLDDLGLLGRGKGGSDRRNVICALTEEGARLVSDSCAAIVSILREGSILSRTNPNRVCRYIDTMGSLSCMAGDLILLGVHQHEDRATVGSLVSMLGLLQPTVSMSVSSLAADGLVDREQGEGSRVLGIRLTSEGAKRAADLAQAIAAMVVRRK